MRSKEFSCIMPFINQSKSFTHGFECGQIWEWSKNGRPFDNYVFHTINEIQVIKILRLYGYDFRIELIDNLWSTIFGTNKAEFN